MHASNLSIVHPRLTPRAETKSLPKHTIFTDEAQARRRMRADKPFFPRSLYYNTRASLDAIRHFVDGYGETNPLFRDSDYAAKTKYGQIVAPGCFLYTVQWASPGFGGPGIHAWYSGGEWEWYGPIFVEDSFTPVCVLRQLEEKQGHMGGGRTWVDHSEVIYVNQRNEIVGKEHGYLIAAERAASGSARKYREVPKPVYLHDDWMKILEAYENEERRGSTPHFWEDVEVGETLGPMIKGPLSVRDEIAWIMGAGSPYLKAHGIEYAYEKRHPKTLQFVEEIGESDVPELVHFLDTFARTIGVERAYDYGNQRQTWLGNLLTNWMGDDGFLWRMRGNLRAFNQMGDVTRFEGKVTRKYVESDKFCVEIEAWAKNQRDEWSMLPGPATVILPSREYGPVVYPHPSPKLYQEVSQARPLNELIGEGLL